MFFLSFCFGSDVRNQWEATNWSNTKQKVGAHLAAGIKSKTKQILSMRSKPKLSLMLFSMISSLQQIHGSCYNTTAPQDYVPSIKSNSRNDTSFDSHILKMCHWIWISGLWPCHWNAPFWRCFAQSVGHVGSDYPLSPPWTCAWPVFKGLTFWWPWDASHQQTSHCF